MDHLKWGIFLQKLNITIGYLYCYTNKQIFIPIKIKESNSVELISKINIIFGLLFLNIIFELCVKTFPKCKTVKLLR